VLLAALPRERDQPADGERPGTALRNLDAVFDRLEKVEVREG